MRKLLAVLALILPLSAYAIHGAMIGIPSAVTAKVHVQGGVANCYVNWTDTAATIVRAEVRRRGIIADTAVTHGPADTLWHGRGYTTGGHKPFKDSCAWGRTYRYQVRDSIAANAFSSWSDSAQVVVPTRKF